MRLPGTLLVAPPTLRNPMFAETVTFIYEDTAKGTSGLVLNEPSNKTLADLAEYCGCSSKRKSPVYVGGPAVPTGIIMLHTPEWASNYTMEINSEFSITSDTDMLDRVFRGDAPKKWKIFFGQSKWQPGTLEEQMHSSTHKAWLYATATQELVFSRSSDRMWDRAIDLVVTQATSNYFSIM